MERQSKRLFKYIAKTEQEIETYINLLPFPVHIIGAPQYIDNGKKRFWIIWFMPYDVIDERAL